MNPSIILGYKQPEIDTPIDSMGKMMKFREAASQEALRAAQVQHYQSLAKQAQFEEEQKRRGMEDESTLQQIQGNPDAYKRIMSGDFTDIQGKVLPGTFEKVRKSVDDFHHQQSIRSEDDLKAHNAGLGELVNAAQGLKELGDIEQINAQLPNVVDNLSRAGAFKAAQIDPTKVPQHITDTKELDTWMASVGGLMAANDAGLKRKLSEEKIKSEQALQAQRLREKEAAAKVVTGKGGVQYNVKGNVAEPILTPEGEQLTADVTSKAAVTTPHTVTTEAGIMQFNPETQRFDIPVGKAPPHAAGGTTSASDDDVKDTARAIIQGHANPTLSNYSFRDRTKLAAQLERAGYDQATAERDWKAVQRHLSTLNGAQQERLRQAITFTYDSLDNIDELYKEWQKLAPVSGFKILNKATLAASKNTPGRTGAVANSLEAQINDLTSELGTVYKGGNSSTDESLRLAAQNLRADWNPETFNKAMQQIRKNLQIRKNSIITSEPAGVSKDSPYVSRPETSAYQEGQTATNPKTKQKLIFRGGKWVPL